MIWDNMKRFLILSFTAMLVFLNAVEANAAMHKTPTVIVLTDSGHRNGTTYLICGAASDIIATDLINELNKTGRIKAPLLGETMSKITQKSIPLFYMTFFNEYKYNFNVDFVNIKRITKPLNADYLLLVTSGLDIQSQFLKETWWNKLSIAGSDPVVPTYKLTTLVTLVDTKNYSIVWQDMYLRNIKANNYDLGVVQFSPSYAQLSKIKKYSKNVSEYVTNIVDRQVNPWIVPPQKPKSVELKQFFLNEGTKVYYPKVNGEVVKQNFDDYKTQKQGEAEKRKREKEIRQQQHIENIRNLQKQESPSNGKNQKEERLFDSIRNNIDDVSNTLPAQTEEKTDKNIKPAVDVQPKVQEKPKEELVKPVMNHPKNGAKKEPTKNKIKPATLKKEPPKKAPNEGTKEELPHYDWNLQNIHLQKIGKSLARF